MSQEDRKVAARFVEEVEKKFGRIKKVVSVAVASNRDAMMTVLFPKNQGRRFRLMKGEVVDEATIGD